MPRGDGLAIVVVVLGGGARRAVLVNYGGTKFETQGSIKTDEEVNNHHKQPELISCKNQIPTT